MRQFEPDGVYNGIPYRVLADYSIEAMMKGGLVKFQNMNQLVASSVSAAADPRRSVIPHGEFDNADDQIVNIPASTGSVDYYSILLEAIKTTKYNSAQLRALVYDRARFNLKRDALFAPSSTDLARLVEKMNELEIAVSRIEASAIGDLPYSVYRQQGKQLDVVYGKSEPPIQILPPGPTPPLYSGLRSIQWGTNFQLTRMAEEFVRHARLSNRFTGIALSGIAVFGVAIVTLILWPSHDGRPRLGIATELPRTAAANIEHRTQGENIINPTPTTSKLPFPLPTSFGIYVLSNNKLTELQGLPISVPDARIGISAEIKKPSTTTISDSKPAFILFRRDLLNNVPPKIMLRVIAQMTRETKIVNGKAVTTHVGGSWRIRNIFRELRISPIEGQREMVIARVDDDVFLTAGRYALVLSQVGYDFTIAGPVQSPVFCLEGFETANGSVLTPCREP